MSVNDTTISIKNNIYVNDKQTFIIDMDRVEYIVSKTLKANSIGEVNMQSGNGLQICTSNEYQDFVRAFLKYKNIINQ